MSSAPGDVTLLLRDMQSGKPEALDALMPLVYEELRTLAHHKLRAERNDHTLNTTALVHEAYLRIVDQRWANVRDRAHFLAIAAQAMRRVLVSYARQRHAQKRGGHEIPASIDDHLNTVSLAFSPDHLDQLLSLDDALTRLETFNERGCRVVEYRFFGGMTHEEVAHVMNLSVPTVRRAWKTSRLWLRQTMQVA
ncbi:MAG: sigma-70 family RNA polymerase sigma factor [Rhodothermales bacterium]